MNVSVGGLGTVGFTGGSLLDDTTNLPADETAVYGTALPAYVECGSCTGYTNPLTITFPSTIHNFYLTVLNGVTTSTNFTVADNAGNSATFTLTSNTSGGQNVIGFAASGTVVTITQTPSSGDFDFFVDNVTFNMPLPPGLNPISTTGNGVNGSPGATPAPASWLLASLGVAIVGLYMLWARKRRASAGIVLMLALAMLVVPTVASAANGILSVRGTYNLTTSQGTVSLTIDKQTGDRFTGTIVGDQLRGNVSGQVTGWRIVFNRVPNGQAWPTDGTGLQSQTYTLDFTPGPAGGKMRGQGSWAGYGQTSASKLPKGLNVTFERIR